MFSHRSDGRCNYGVFVANRIKPQTRQLNDNSDDPESDAGSKTRPDASTNEDVTDPADAGKAKQTGPTCPSTAVDDPDDSFTDSNCDGIDGDKSKAIFVATTGSDTADGSIGSPVATLNHGIEVAIAAKKDVYVCKGNYSEPSIQIATSGVRVYGGYDCTKAWQRNSSSQAQLVSTSSTAVSVKDVSAPVVFDRIDITAASATAGSDSSTALLVSNSSNVTLRHGTYAAGSGADAVQPSAKSAATNSLPDCATYVYPSGCYGEPGTDAYQYKNCFYDSIQGATCITSAPLDDSTVFKLAPQSTLTATNQCKKDFSHGGRGGGTSPTNSRIGSPGMAGSPASTTGTLDGADGVVGKLVSGASVGFGTLTSAGYVPSNQGEAGNDGLMGEAGTGAFGGGIDSVYSAGAGDFPYYAYAPMPGGGKGGWAGCPGDGGDAGNAGGASIAVAIYQSQVTLDRLVLTTSKGGNGAAGGLGGAGATGQPGGAPGTAYYQCASCVASQNSICSFINKTNNAGSFGGKGGNGGDGSQGGPGGGGPSIAVLVNGATPTLSAVTFLPGSGGIGGSNGGPRAADGESADQKVLP